MLFISLLLIIPLVFFLIFNSIHSVQILNEEMEKTGKDTIRLYQQNLEGDLKKLELGMSNYWAADTEHQMLYYKLDPVVAHLNTLNIWERYKTTMTTYSSVGAMFICSEKNDLYRGLFYSEYDHFLREEIQEFVRELVRRPEEHSEPLRGWQVYEIQDRPFLVRMSGNYGAYNICLVDLALTALPQDMPDNTNGSVLYYNESNGVPLTSRRFISERGISLSQKEQGHQIVGEQDRFLAVKSALSATDIELVYLVPYYGSFYHMNSTQLFLLLFSVGMLLLIPLVYLLLVELYFRPLQKLSATINRIRDGDLAARIPGKYRIREFEDINESFHSMVDTISSLRITTYEKELERQRAEMQYLHLQIKPHFFINCLKTLYGMIQQKKYQKTQDMLLNVSQYIRYVFQSTTTLVPLQVEMEHVKTYIRIQENGMAVKPYVEYAVDTDSLSCPVPTFIVQTFVENAFKYGQVPGQTLELYIQSRYLKNEEGDYLNIIIRDNGGGFSDQFLQARQTEADAASPDQKIGILNVRQRLALLYQEKAVLLFENTSGGAKCELFLPVSGKEEAHDGADH